MHSPHRPLVVIASLALSAVAGCTQPVPSSSSNVVATAATEHADRADHGEGDKVTTCGEPEAQAECLAAHAAEATGQPSPAQGREAVDVDGVVRRGARLSDDQTLTVAELAARAGELDGKSVKVTGRVQQACQRMGCWFVLESDDKATTIRISSRGHDLYVPKSSAGRIATAEGTFRVRVLDKALAQHFADEGEQKPGQPRAVIAGDVKELSISASGLEMRQPG